MEKNVKEDDRSLSSGSIWFHKENIDQGIMMTSLFKVKTVAARMRKTHQQGYTYSRSDLGEGMQVTTEMEQKLTLSLQTRFFFLQL